ncbi:Beta-propeller repeat protein [Nostoc sp. DSM 114161]|jgi:hypothetical protein|uniref:DUF7948 domain-containing protein n=1 Tax=Nostoc sp. DSM 114161 TaxID=3440143 RepID=UPI0040466AE8
MIPVKQRLTRLAQQHTRLDRGAFVRSKQLKALLKTTILGSVALVFGLVAPVSTVSLNSNASTLKVSAQNQLNAAEQARILSTYTSLPLRFEVNQGQVDKQVNFLARGNGYSVFLTPAEAVLSLHQTQTASTQKRQPAIGSQQTPTSQTSFLRLQLVNSNSTAKVKGIEQLPSNSNYFLGKESHKWHRDIANYAKVQYQAVYPGIDLLYYGNQSQLEYDFIVAPGGNSENIRLRVAGASKLEIDQQGNLLLHTPKGVIRQHRPIIYQQINGNKQPIAGGYVLLGKQEVGFKIAAYDRKQPLTIDPVVTYSTYLGGSGTDFGGYAVGLDRAGNVYVAGQTYSTDFPTNNAFDNTLSGNSDIFVTKLNLAKSGIASLVYSTYLGGSNSENSFLEIAVDLGGNAYVAGVTTSSDFPTKNAFDSTFSGSSDGFVTKLNAKGDRLLYSTYLGSDTDIRAIAVDKLGNAYVTGFTGSTEFPIKNAFDITLEGGQEAFVTKLNPDAFGNASLVYSSFLGGNNSDVGFGIAVDSNGNAYITGYTSSTDFPIKNAFDITLDGNLEAFLTKVNAKGNSILYSTYLGGSGNDLGSGIAVDCFGNVYVTGQTYSSDFPTKKAFDSTLGGFVDAFVTKLNPHVSGKSSLVYSTYLGGNDYELGYSLVVDKYGNAYVIGSTGSQDFPTKNAFDSTLGSNLDAFVTKVNATGQSLIYSSYLGGNNSDEGYGIAINWFGDVYVTGQTSSSDFPTKNAFDSTLGGDLDAFVTKISP